jgi:hypothetical protein
MGQTAIESLPEERRNALLRRQDWRFLLRGSSAPAADAPHAIGFPSRRAIAAARAALPEGGELLCSWRLPRPWGTQRARRRLERAGFSDLRLLWPGPLPHRLPQFWLPPDSPAAIEHLLASRPPSSSLQAALRPLWRLAARLGLLAPVFVLARLPAGDAVTNAEDELAPYLGGDTPCLLLSGGNRSINKVVALPFPPGAPRPAAVVKFSRLPEAEQALGREAEALESLARTQPDVEGVPRILGRGRRGGGFGLAESAIYGKPLIGELSPRNFGELAVRVAGRLAGLAAGAPNGSPDWRERLVAAPLAEFERNFGAVAAPGTVEAARALLGELEELPQVCEHRDCSPWNVLLDEGGSPALLDWESAEPRGLPGLDLAYFLANAAFVLDGSLDSGRTRESYARLLDPADPHYAASERCIAVYCERVGLSRGAFDRLRLLAWIVHSKSDHAHLTMATGSAPQPQALRGSTFLGLVEEELAQRPSVSERG